MSWSTKQCDTDPHAKHQNLDFPVASVFSGKSLLLYECWNVLIYCLLLSKHPFFFLMFFILFYFFTFYSFQAECEFLRVLKKLFKQTVVQMCVGKQPPLHLRCTQASISMANTVLVWISAVWKALMTVLSGPTNMPRHMMMRWQFCFDSCWQSSGFCNVYCKWSASSMCVIQSENHIVDMPVIHSFPHKMLDRADSAQRGWVFEFSADDIL